jgi:DNA topoisomerase-3
MGEKMKLILAEKPSVAKNIADALNIKAKKDGYFEGNDYLITWAFGHLVELYDAKDYDSKMTSWKMDNFPFIPAAFKYKVKSNPKNRKQADGVHRNS